MAKMIGLGIRNEKDSAEFDRFAGEKICLQTEIDKINKENKELKKKLGLLKKEDEKSEFSKQTERAK
ncbi:MAG: hypothetical protein ACK5I7_08790 [Anaerotignum sp.]